jgi:hypothetical protein
MRVSKLVFASLSLVTSLMTLSVGCAGISVTPLTHDGQKADEEKGVRYYMPRPYLLVMDLKQPPVAKSEKPPADASAYEFKDKNTKTSDTGSKDSGDKSESDSASAAPSDLSFSAQTPIYVAKLIYLPDLSHPMALRVSTGLIGTSSMKPTLQDGWMLTSLDSSADSKASEMMTAVGSVIGSVLGTGGGGKAQAKGSDTTAFMYLPQDSILKPGLYRFNYDTSGHMTGLCQVTSFEGGTADSTNGLKECQDKFEGAKPDAGSACCTTAGGATRSR